MSEEEHEELPVRTSSKSRKKHIIQKEEKDEPEEKPLIPVLFRKGKEKVITPPASDDEIEQIDAEMEVAAARVTRTPTEAKQLFDIIATITTEGHAADGPALAPPHQTPTNLFVLVLEDTIKEREALLEALLQQHHQNQKGPDRFQPSRMPQLQPLPPSHCRKRKKCC